METIKTKKVIPKSTLRYRFDSEYRARVIQLNKDYREKNKQYPEFIKLCKLRNVICNHNYAIEHHRERIHYFKGRIYKVRKQIEVLEIKWGELRAKLKKEGRY